MAVPATPRSQGLCGARRPKSVPKVQEGRFPIMEQLTEKVLSALASTKHIPVETIKLESSLDDLGLDSLDKVTLLFELEQQLNLSIPDEELRSVRTVADVVAAISKIAASASSGAVKLGDPK
jgi:acyl carrier protein